MKSVDIVSLYKEFNRKYFGNILPHDLPVKWGKMKNKSGYAKASVVRSRSSRELISITPIRIVLNSLLERDMDSVIGLLLHEMVHISLYVEGNTDVGHGSVFLKKLKEIEKISGIGIPVSDELDDDKLSDEYEGKTKELYFKLHFNENKWWIMLMMQTAFVEYYAKAAPYYDKSPPNNKMYIGKVNTNLWHHFKVTRKINFSKIYSYVIKDAAAEKILKDAKIYKKYE
jgi:hypothetical protein